MYVHASRGGAEREGEQLKEDDGEVIPFPPLPPWDPSLGQDLPGVGDSHFPESVHGLQLGRTWCEASDGLPITSDSTTGQRKLTNEREAGVLTWVIEPRSGSPGVWAEPPPAGEGTVTEKLRSLGPWQFLLPEA